ncbi:hypothetical protein MuYL_2375 [Mucilaginibacter xinganensis]|uniref:Uncharacterized protein n=1 Tax=Mucilaginibacter xinganensis TaxID=1234841 RepID=A0A223NX43_9SPHI|nr:hypothetical protein MuYL_2375 [Mucilaginibacter xinganensis]
MLKKITLAILIAFWLGVVYFTWRTSSGGHESDYYEIWAFGSLISIIIFGAFFVLINTPYLILNLAKCTRTRGIYLLILVTIVVVFILTIVAVIAGIEFYNILYTENAVSIVQKNKPFTIGVHYLQLITVIMFFLADMTCFLTIPSALKKKLDGQVLNGNGNEQIEDQIAHEELVIEKSLLFQTMIFVDLPSVITIVLLVCYSHYFSSLPHLDVFLGGSEAFALISFNIVYIMILLKFGHKFHYLNKAIA